MTDEEDVFLNTSWNITAVCPECDRSETFENQPMAQAWLTGHINNAHLGETPAFVRPYDD